MKKQRLSGLLGLLVMGGLLTTCFGGCRQAQPEPEPDATATSKLSQTSTTTIESVQTTTTTTNIATTTTTDPLGYVDLIDAEEWPWRKFNTVEGFIHWIENPDFTVEENPFEPKKDEHGYDVYKTSYFDALYPDYQQMFAVDRFYMLPDVPSDWDLTNIYINSNNVEFYYQDNQKNKYYFSYNYCKSGKLDVETSEFFAFKKTLNDQEYYVMDYDLKRVAAKKGHYIWSLVNGYLCKLGIQTYHPNKKDSVTEGYERVIYSEDTDLTDAVSKIKFKRIDLPPLK